MRHLYDTRKTSLEVQNDRCSVAYRLFRRRIIQKSASGSPAASTPLSTGGQHNHSHVLDSVRQRLWMDSPPRDQTRTMSSPPRDQIRPRSSSPSWDQTRPRSRLCEPGTEQQMCPCDDAGAQRLTVRRGATRARRAPRDTASTMVWRPVGDDRDGTNSPGSDVQPFSVLSPKSESHTRLAAPSLLDDYYTNLLDCSVDGLVALALGTSVYLWNSHTRALVGRLASSPSPGQSSHSRSVLSLSWSSDGRTLCVGNRSGDVELWDVHRALVLKLWSHQSAVRAVSWRQDMVSSGSVLGLVQHQDPRGGSPVGSVSVQGGVCGLQWSEAGQLACGSVQGQVHVWDKNTYLQRPVITMDLPSSVKAMQWCPWQQNTIATGGGWRDGAVRIWDTTSGTCLSSAQTNSQICSLRWTGQKQRLVTGHGVPQHHITSWVWDQRDLTLTHQNLGHSKRVLHLALNRDGSQMFSAAADQSLRVWDQM